MVSEIIKKLPEDLILYILRKFPVKSLMRFKCISKVWHTIIKSNTFIKFHLSRTITTKDESFLFKHSIKDESEEFKNILSFLSGNSDVLDHHFPDIDVACMAVNCTCTFNPLIGPCHGLICLTDSITTIVINPATRNFRLVPPSPFTCPKGFHRSIEGFGFGFDSISDDYKIVRISEVYWDPDYDYPGPSENKIDIYDFGIDFWRELDQEQLPSIYSSQCAETLYKEAVHWFANLDMSVEILCFDMNMEIFRNMKLPDACIFNHDQLYGLVILSDSLTLICYPNPMGSSDPPTKITNVWVMQDYGLSESWIMKYTIRPLPIESPLAVWKNNLLLLQSKSGLLISHELDTDEVKEYNLHGFPGSLSVVVYNDCLTSVSRGSKHTINVQIYAF